MKLSSELLIFFISCTTFSNIFNMYVVKMNDESCLKSAGINNPLPFIYRALWRTYVILNRVS